MNISEFSDKVKNAMQDYLADDARVCITQVTKNNGVILWGLCIQRKESRVSPTIYLEKLHERYENGECFSDLISELITMCEKNTGEWIDVDYFTDYSMLRDRIIFKLINYEMNETLLKDVPFETWNDLAVVFCHVVSIGQNDNATILIRNEHMKMWGIGKEQLFQDAKTNTPKLLGDEMISMTQVLADMSYSTELEAANNIYVLSNRNRIFGAASILYSDKLSELSQICKCGLYILPSSIHEVIVVPESEECDCCYMRQMIHDVNTTVVDVEERLSDNLYYYSMEDKCISVVGDTVSSAVV